MKEPAKYYEELYFFDGRTELSVQSQKICTGVLDKNRAVGICGFLREEGYPIYCLSGFALTALGYTFGELMKKTEGNVLNLLYEKDRALFEADCINGEDRDFEFRMVNFEGQNVWFHAYKDEAENDNGDKIIVLSLRIIEEARKREEELLTALARDYRTIIYLEETKKRYKIVKSPENNKNDVGTLDELFSYLKDYNEKHVYPDDCGFSELLQILQGLIQNHTGKKKSYNTTYRVRWKGGFRWNEFQIIRSGDISLDTGHIILTFRDVDEQTRKKLEESQILVESLARAESANNLKTDFLSKMSHDMRTPINGIMGMVEKSNSCLSHPEQVRACNSEIIKSCQTLVELLSDILEMHSLENGEVELTALARDYRTIIYLEETKKYSSS